MTQPAPLTLITTATVVSESNKMANYITNENKKKKMAIYYF